MTIIFCAIFCCQLHEQTELAARGSPPHPRMRSIYSRRIGGEGSLRVCHNIEVASVCCVYLALFHYSVAVCQVYARPCQKVTASVCICYF